MTDFQVYLRIKAYLEAGHKACSSADRHIAELFPNDERIADIIRRIDDPRNVLHD